MPKNSAARLLANKKYNEKAYDYISAVIPKGQKAVIQRAATDRGETINSFVNKALIASLGLTEWPKTMPDD